MTGIDRRTLLMLVAMGLTHDRAVRALQARGGAPGAGQFFTPEELSLVETLSELIIPADDRSGGARAAGVPAFIDLVVAHSGSDVQARWRLGLTAVDRLASPPGEPASGAFRALSLPDQARLLDTLAAEEGAPSTDAGRLFVEIKRMTLRGYYTSEVGVRGELGYRGPEALDRFPGCQR
jgi:gluconate 2-dehydrogenase gamma chain